MQLTDIATKQKVSLLQSITTGSPIIILNGGTAISFGSRFFVHKDQSLQ